MNSTNEVPGMPVERPAVLVIGDEMVDRYVIGEVSRVSPEAPVPVVKVNDTRLCRGGAGNVAENLTKLGASVLVIAGEGTPIKNRLMVGDTQVARWDELDKCEPLNATQIQLVKSLLARVVSAVVIADYAKGTITNELIEALEDAQLPTFVDSKRDPYDWAGIKNLVYFPNCKEFEAWQQDYEGLAADGTMVVLKSGAEGMSQFQGVYGQSLPSYARSVRSVSGAGDTVIAAYAYATLIGCPNPLKFASAAAAIAVEQPYTYAPSYTEVATRLMEL